MSPLVSNFFQPLAGLRVPIRQIDEGAQRPEVLAHIADRSFDFTFIEERPLQMVAMVTRKFLP